MINSLYKTFNITSPVAGIIISVALMLITGFAMTRITKRLRLPNVTAYILSGVLLGPYVLNLVPQDIVEGMDFLNDIALAFIAFSTGEFFRFSTLKKNGGKVVVITVLEACLASIIVFIVSFFILGLDINFSLVLGALASATAPASTVMTIRQTHAKGDFVDTLLQVVALDDVVGLVAYSAAISVALANASGHFSAGSVLKPIGLNLLVFAIGCLFGLILKLLLQKRSTDNRLIVSVALLFSFCGICTLLDVSPLLGCMAMGMVYINLSDDERLFKQLNYFNPPILLLFFVRSGLNFNLSALFDSSSSIGHVPLIVVGVCYFFTRIIGKYAGAFLGCLITKKNHLVRNYLGLALIPQAGVAIGLAAMGARTLGGASGSALETIILASSVLYELIGPGCAKLSLYLSKSYSNKLEDIVEIAEDGHQKSKVELLIERIQAIQNDLPKHENPYYEDEQAFSEAADEQYLLAGMSMDRSRKTGGEEDERNNRICPLGPYRPSARRMVNGTQHIFDNTQDSGGCHIRVSHRLRALEQASLGGTAHFRAHLLCLDRLDDTRHISHDELLVQRARALGGDDNRHRDGQRQLDTVQLPQSDKGTDDLRRTLGLRNPRIHDRRGTLYRDRHSLCFPALHPRLLPVA